MYYLKVVWLEGEGCISPVGNPIISLGNSLAIPDVDKATTLIESEGTAT